MQGVFRGEIGGWDVLCLGSFQGTSRQGKEERAFQVCEGDSSVQTIYLLSYSAGAFSLTYFLSYLVSISLLRACVLYTFLHR